MPRKRVRTPERDNDPLDYFAGDLETSRVRFRAVADLMTKHGDARLLNHASFSMSMFLKTRSGINCDWVEKELDEERRRIERRGQFSIVARKA